VKQSNNQIINIVLYYKNIIHAATTVSSNVGSYRDMAGAERVEDGTVEGQRSRSTV